ncbi:MAG: hypothetical protein V1934_01030 [Methanobacteriota archaeon]
MGSRNKPSPITVQRIAKIIKKTYNIKDNEPNDKLDADIKEQAKLVKNLLKGKRTLADDEIEKQVLSFTHVHTGLMITTNIQSKIKELYRLSGGYSGDQVYRTKHSISIGGEKEDGQTTLSEYTTVLKISKSDIPDYDKIESEVPGPILHLFAQPHKPEQFTYKNDRLHVMRIEYLADFEPLYEFIWNRSFGFDNKHLESLWGAFNLMYSQTKKVDSANQLLALTKPPYLEHFYRDILKFNDTMLPLIYPEAEYIVNGFKYKNVRFYVERILTNYPKFIPPFNTIQHGDCHGRNVFMEKVSRHANSVKFIDIDQLSLRGDYIYDLGELLSDIAIFSPIHTEEINGNKVKYKYAPIKINYHVVKNEHRINYTLPKNERVDRFVQFIEGKLDIFAKENKDTGYKHRLCVSKAAALLRVASFTPFPKSLIPFSEAIKLLDECEKIDIK